MPEMPKEEMAARRGRGPGGQGAGAVSSASGVWSQGTCGVAVAACKVAGKVACCRARVILMIPAMPAAAWVWPMLDLTEPSQSGRWPRPGL